MKEESGFAWANFFNAHAPVYEENCFTKNTFAEVDFLVEELGLRSGEQILDLGCGTGRHSIELARRGFDVTGLDFSPGMLREARANAAAAGVQVTWIERDAREFSFPEKFDAVICLCEGAFGLLNSGDDPIGQPLSILRNVAAALKPHGRCLFTALNAYRLCRKHSQESVTQGTFDPFALAERSDIVPADADESQILREKGFTPTELALLFAFAGMKVTNMWGGTAGNWGRRTLDLDEFELMATAAKSADPLGDPQALFRGGPTNTRS